MPLSAVWTAVGALAALPPAGTFFRAASCFSDAAEAFAGASVRAASFKGTSPSCCKGASASSFEGASLALAGASFPPTSPGWMTGKPSRGGPWGWSAGIGSAK